MKLTVIIVCWNGKQNIETLFPTLKASEGDFDLIVVDNHSADGSPELVERLWPEATVLRQSDNLGFAGGNNVGMKVALERGADIVLLLNDDTQIVDPSWLEDTKNAFEENPSLGVLGFTLFPDKQSALESQSSVVISGKRHVVGCAMAMRADALRDLGLFDEVYFAYNEEDDLCLRFKLAGYTTMMIGRRIVHFGEATSSRIRDYASFLELRNAIRYSVKWRSPFATAARCVKLLSVCLLPDRTCARFTVNLVRARGGGSMPKRLARFLKALWWNIAAFPESRRIAAAERLRIANHAGRFKS